MEVALLDLGSIKIRSKIATFVVDPTINIPKTEAVGVVLLGSVNANTSKVAESRVILAGPGEYEVKGVKITSIKSDGGALYKLELDRMNVVVATGSALSKAENAPEAQVVIINADSLPSDKVITAMQSNVVILYGEKKLEAAKILKDVQIAPVNKFSVTSDKLPQELEVVVLQ